MKKRFVAILMATGMFVLAGCSAGTSRNSAAENLEQEMAVADEVDGGGWSSGEPGEISGQEDLAQAESGAAQEAGGELAETEKIIKTYDVSLQTRDYEQTVLEIEEKLTELGGYVEASEKSGQEGYRWCTLTLRIPADQAENFLTAAGEAGTITHQSASTENVTLTYVDVQSHIEALKTEQETLLRLMEEAEKMEDVLAIQSQLTSVRYELDSYESQLRVLENRVSYSTITIDINEVERVSVQEQKGFFAESWAKMQDTLYGFGQLLRAFGIWLIGSSPVLVLLGLGIAGITALIRKIRRKKQDGKDKKSEKKEDRKI